ncbi:pur operon repressor [Alicyclobacillus fastidiosus]|uniref:Pur operon repressor n=1 Tax=Alicyclobacillus fastidiosus TaxID=392011 RepID=A0ABY6ZJ23_9BACL|nr:pur operon repressor [Alicyclobacillus fastidiosus]WAH42201.1 pur operon repressor [Alicyclobacillus fastidiosus]GMA63993.1 pur operon repressor [Alicyclobacillus fastidiosus]
MQRSERLIRLTQLLVERPLQALSLAHLSEAWDIAKSSLSEDVATIRKTLAEAQRGIVETSVGAQGGVRFHSGVPMDEARQFLDGLAHKLSKPDRVLPGDFVYLSDVLGDPHVLDTVGRLVSMQYTNKGINVVVTVETKGITLAAATARHLNVPIAIVRRDQRVTEGPTISTHYVSGSTRRIQTMSLGKRTIPPDARALIVDDFMRAGATARAVEHLLKEFSATVVGTAVFMATSQPTHKMVNDYFALLRVHEVSEQGVHVEPATLIDIQNG